MLLLHILQGDLVLIAWFFIPFPTLRMRNIKLHCAFYSAFRYVNRMGSLVVQSVALCAFIKVIKVKGKVGFNIFTKLIQLAKQICENCRDNDIKTHTHTRACLLFSSLVCVCVGAWLLRHWRLSMSASNLISTQKAANCIR